MVKKDKLSQFNFQQNFENREKSLLKDDEVTELVVPPVIKGKAVKDKSDKPKPRNTPQQKVVKKQKVNTLPVRIEEEIVTFYRDLGFKSKIRNFGNIINDVLREDIAKRKSKL